MEQYFYSTDILEKVIILPESEAVHVLKVLRKRAGDKIKVVDGLGNLFNTSIISEDIKDCRLNIESIDKNFGELDYYIHIGLSPTKSHDRIEFFVEKIIEIGVQEITFILTDNAERKNIKLKRINKCAISAMKQSLKAFIPKINDIILISDFLKKCNNNQKFIANLDRGHNSHLIKSAPYLDNYCILIGPEGDFTSNEINQSLDYGFKPVSLGQNRLRSETAGIVACQILNLVNYKE